MALPHANPGDPVDVAPYGAGLAGQVTTALFKSHDLEVMRLVLPAGKVFPPHKVAGEITIQCLEGSLRIEAPGTSCVLQSRQLLFLAGGVLHSVEALEDASALLTIVLARSAAAA